jgi:predicted RNase H-like nuclease (RuvC/YqgF family)
MYKELIYLSVAIITIIGSIFTMLKYLLTEIRNETSRQFAEVRSDIKVLYNEIKTIKENHLAHLQQDNKDLKNENIDIKKEINNIKSDIVLLKAEMIVIKSDIGIIKNLLEKMQK